MNESAPIKDAAREPPALPFAKRVRYALEAAGFFTVIGFFKLFGTDTASAIGGWIGRNLVAPTVTSGLAIENLTAAYPEKSASEVRAIVRAMWDNLGRVMGEYAHLDRIHSNGADPRIELVGREHVDAARAQGKGILFISGHFANWEIMPWAARDIGLQGGVVVRPANNPYVNRWLEKTRSRNGMTEQVGKGAAGTRRMFALLRRGDVALLLADQRTSEGVKVPFFRREAFTTPAPAALALKLGAVVLPVSNQRVGGARFRVRVYPALDPPATGDHDRDIIVFTGVITAFIEARVRERPAEWLWIHKRWVRDDAPLRKRAASQRADAETNGD